VPEWFAVAVLLLLAGVLSLLLPMALHRSWLLAAARRGGPTAFPPWSGDLPRVTVQLPVFNEIHVVERLLDAACSLDHPKDRLEIQLLDDSTDATPEVARKRVEEWRARGVNVVHLHRSQRVGFKAGALEEGRLRASGDFLLILDADFVPGPDLIQELLPPFLDPGVGMVQARWDHLNEDRNLLTRAQAFLLDAHFRFEHGGRHAAGLFFNFNGTAGMWRASTLEDAGGWAADTLTEDLDVSYRAQMEGWRFVYLPEVGVPAELPARVRAFQVQQKRWAQGGIQTARKLLPRLLRGPYPRRVKVEAVFHLCGHLAHPLTLLLGLLLYPAILARQTLGLHGLLPLDLALFSAATLPFLLFYGAAGRSRGRPWRRVLPGVVETLCVGIGTSVPVSRAVFRGLRRLDDPFIRTPKDGGVSGPTYPSTGGWGDVVLKLVLGGGLLGAAVLALRGGASGSLPFLLLFAIAYLAMGVREALEGLVPLPPASPPPLPPRTREDPEEPAKPEPPQEEEEDGAPCQELDGRRVTPFPGGPVAAQAPVGD